MNQSTNEATSSPAGMTTRKRSRVSMQITPTSTPVVNTDVSVAGSVAASTSSAEDATPLSNLAHAPRKKARLTLTPTPVESTESAVDAPDTNLIPDASNICEGDVKPTQLKYEPKQIILGTLHCYAPSHLVLKPDGLLLSVKTQKNETAEVVLTFRTINEYLVCDSPALPLLIIRSFGSFGETIRAALPSLKRTDELLSADVFDPLSSDKCHSFIMFEMKSVGELCDLISKLMHFNANEDFSTGRLLVPRSISLEEAKRKLHSTQCVVFKWKEMQLGTWKSKPCADSTVHMSGSRIKFKANTGVGADVTLAVHLNEINSLMLCVAQANPVLFIRTTEAFGWSARDRLGISSTFQQGKDYYNPDSPETRFKFITFRLEKQGVSRESWQNMYEVSGERYFTFDHISSRVATEMLHKLIYQPVQCTSVRVGANEFDEIRAVTIHFDSLCICGCMLDSVVTMNICIADIKELSICLHDKVPVLFVKTSTAISDTLKKNMASRSADVFFDPNSKDIKTQYIVIELSTTSKLSLKKIHHTLQTVLSNFNDRCNVPREQRANFVKLLSKQKAEELVAKIKEPLPAKECVCCKKEDIKHREEVKQYVQSMTQRHGCSALEKIASRAVDLQKKILCSVCLDKDCQIVFTCGHMICERCDQSLRKCHICRMKILKRIKIFM